MSQSNTVCKQSRTAQPRKALGERVTDVGRSENQINTREAGSNREEIERETGSEARSDGMIERSTELSGICIIQGQREDKATRL